MAADGRGLRRQGGAAGRWWAGGGTWAYRGYYGSDYFNRVLGTQAGQIDLHSRNGNTHLVSLASFPLYRNSKPQQSFLK